MNNIGNAILSVPKFIYNHPLESASLLLSIFDRATESSSEPYSQQLAPPLQENTCTPLPNLFLPEYAEAYLGLGSSSLPGCKDTDPIIIRDECILSMQDFPPIEPSGTFSPLTSPYSDAASLPDCPFIVGEKPCDHPSFPRTSNEEPLGTMKFRVLDLRSECNKVNLENFANHFRSSECFQETQLTPKSTTNTLFKRISPPTTFEKIKQTVKDAALCPLERPFNVIHNIAKLRNSSSSLIESVPIAISILNDLIIIKMYTEKLAPVIQMFIGSQDPRATTSAINNIGWALGYLQGGFLSGMTGEFLASRLQNYIVDEGAIGEAMESLVI